MDAVLNIAGQVSSNISLSPNVAVDNTKFGNHENAIHISVDEPPFKTSARNI